MPRFLRGPAAFSMQSQIASLCNRGPVCSTFLRSPWQAKALLAVLCFGLAWLVHVSSQEIEAEKSQALQDGVAVAVSLNAFGPKRDVHAADEVHVIGWVDSELNYKLTETRKGKRSSRDGVRRMFVMFGPDDMAKSNTARAVVLLPEHEVDRFVQDDAHSGGH